MTDWQDMIVGARMAVDREFDSRIENSPFSRQEWGLIMTAATFEIEAPADEDAAEIVADTRELRGMMPEIEKIATMTPMSNPQDESDSGGLFDTILKMFGLGGKKKQSETDEEKLKTAESLVAEYASELQTYLESEGRWDEIRTIAAEGEDGSL